MTGNRLIRGAVVVALAVAAVVGALAFFGARDEGSFEAPAGPGRALTAADRDLLATGDRRTIELGNVLLLHGPAGARAELRALAREVAGGSDPALSAAGQAVIVRREPYVDGVIALSSERAYETADAADPGLRAFVEAWLGR